MQWFVKCLLPSLINANGVSFQNVGCTEASDIHPEIPGSHPGTRYADWAFCKLN
jgi:hypothetical protein